MKSTLPYHSPVLLDEVISLLVCKRDGVYLDGTLGGGGHFSAIAEKLGPDATLIGIDQDEEAINWTRDHFKTGRDFTLILEQSRFSDFDMVLKRYSIPGLDGILLDLGVSSHQIDSPERGFSYLQSAPLDMRMNPAEGVPAYQLLEQSSEQELATILNDYGEIHGALRIARALKIRQLSEPIKTSSDLQAFCAEIFGTHLSMNFLARLFQSLRIAVNDELGELRRFLGKVIRYLAPSGRLAVISYHSLEDRLVKEFIRDNEKNCICPREILKCNCTNAPLLKRVTKKALKPSALETHANRRARSARLRIAERTRAAL